MPRSAVIILVCLLLCTASHCQADSYALLIGIDTNEHVDAINGLAGAPSDAKALALENTQGEHYEITAMTLVAQGQRNAALTAARKAIAMGDKGVTGIYQVLGLIPGRPY